MGPSGGRVGARVTIRDASRPPTRHNAATRSNLVWKRLLAVITLHRPQSKPGEDPACDGAGNLFSSRWLNQRLRLRGIRDKDRLDQDAGHLGPQQSAVVEPVDVVQRNPQ